VTEPLAFALDLVEDAIVLKFSDRVSCVKWKWKRARQVIGSLRLTIIYPAEEGFSSQLYHHEWVIEGNLRGAVTGLVGGELRLYLTSSKSKGV
jgi:hypothetical protein